MEKIRIDTEYIKLDQLLKLEGIAEKGSHAKTIILSGAVKVNGETEIKRGRKIYKGYVIKYKGKEYMVE